MKSTGILMIVIAIENDKYGIVDLSYKMVERVDHT